MTYPPMTPGGRETTSISRDAIEAGYKAACELQGRRHICNVTDPGALSLRVFSVSGVITDPLHCVRMFTIPSDKPIGLKSPQVDMNAM